MLFETIGRAVRDKEERTENPNNQLTETDDIDVALNSNTGVATDMEGKESVGSEALIEGALCDADGEAIYMENNGDVEEEEEEEGMSPALFLGLETTTTKNENSVSIVPHPREETFGKSQSSLLH